MHGCHGWLKKSTYGTFCPAYLELRNFNKKNNSYKKEIRENDGISFFCKAKYTLFCTCTLKYLMHHIDIWW